MLFAGNEGCIVAATDGEPEIRSRSHHKRASRFARWFPRLAPEMRHAQAENASRGPSGVTCSSDQLARWQADEVASSYSHYPEPAEGPDLVPCHWHLLDCQNLAC